MDSVPPASVALCVGAVSHAVLENHVLISVLVSTAGYLLTSYVLDSRKRRSYAPGPARWPIVGNAFQIPQTHPWLTYSQWAKTFGDIIHVDVFGQSIIVLNSRQVAHDLLDKRSSVYSDRPRLVMAGDLVGYSQGFVLQPYGEEWRRQRKLVNADFSQTAIPRYHSLQETQARKLVYSVLEDPSSLVPQTKFRIASIIMQANYGYTVKSEQDPLITVPLAAMENFGQASAPGAFFVDFIPQMKHLPEWVPGTGFLQKAKTWRQTCMASAWEPYLWCKDNLRTGVANTPSLCSTTLTQADGGLSKEDEFTVVWAAAAVLGGGLDTNMSTIFTFVLAMVRYPEVQAKARAEIDAVVGLDRVPSIADRQSLPYIRGLITEVYRWNPAIPLGLPHALSRDDEYNGIHLPKGSLVMPNVWHMLHDPEAYPQPFEFKPERYNGLDSEMQKVTDVAFGFGRRACPGFQFAQGSIFAVVATFLATSEILPFIDEHGNKILPEVAYASGSIVFPEPFKCTIRSRSARWKALLSQSVPSLD